MHTKHRGCRRIITSAVISIIQFRSITITQSIRSTYSFNCWCIHKYFQCPHLVIANLDILFLLCATPYNFVKMKVTPANKISCWYTLKSKWICYELINSGGRMLRKRSWSTSYQDTCWRLWRLVIHIATTGILAMFLSSPLPRCSHFSEIISGMGRQGTFSMTLGRESVNIMKCTNIIIWSDGRYWFGVSFIVGSWCLLLFWWTWKRIVNIEAECPL